MDAVKTGSLICEKRKELGLTQKDLAQALHVSTQAVSKWERGLNFPDISLLEPLSQQLGFTVAELLAGERDASVQEELLRDSLRMSLNQLGTRIKTWRRLFAAVAAALLSLLVWTGYFYIRDHTKLLPQRETVIAYRESTPGEDLAAQIADLGSSLSIYDVTYADGITGESLQMELWTEDGLVKTWQLGKSGNADPDDWPRHGTITVSLNIKPSEKPRCGAALHFGLWNHTLEDVPYLECGFGSNVLEGPAVVDREHGVVLACYYLDPTGQGRWQAEPWLGNVGSPEVEQDQAYLLLRLLYEYE